MYQGYGMTEASAVLTSSTAEDHRAGGDLLRSAGRPLPGVVLSIQDGEGNPVPTGETGEVCARAGNFMREYWNQPEETAEAFRGGWYHTGDAGYLDDQGYLYLVDRVKDMIVTGGENVYSIEVENALASHPARGPGRRHRHPARAVGRGGARHRRARADGATRRARSSQVYARERIAGYKVPKSIEFRAEPLPLSGAMKVLKRDLRAPYWEGQERAVH